MIQQMKDNSGPLAEGRSIQLTRQPGLHRISGPYFGLGEDNYMGALPQDNTPAMDWTDFFRDRRLQPQVRLAASMGTLSVEACRQFDHLYERLPDLFPAEPPAFLHGDLCPLLIHLNLFGMGYLSNILHTIQRF